MTRFSALLVLGAAGVLFSPSAASAQFGLRGFGAGGLGIRAPGLGMAPRFGYSYGQQFRFNTMLGSFSYGYRYSYAGIVPPTFYYPYPFYPAAPTYLQNGSYMTGGSAQGTDVVMAAQREVAEAQREAALGNARDQIGNTWKYETGGGAIGAAGPAPVDPAADALRKALAATDPSAVASGDALNAILAEVIKADAKNTKGAPSAYIPPLLIADVRFAGSPAADLLTYARLAGSLPYPAAFDDPTLAPLRDDFDKAFTEATTPVLTGREPTVGAATRAENAFDKLQTAAGAVLKNLPFDESAAARRFLNRLGGAVKGMKGNTPVGLIDPKWAVEGLSVADLVKHMARHKLQFGPAAPGSEETYTTMHRNLATYLFVLTPPPQKK